MKWTVELGDCVEQMREMDEASVDAIVCDPPYGLEFMGKEWDKLDRHGPASFENLGDGERYRKGGGAAGGRTTSPLENKPRFSTMGPIAIQAMQQWHQAWATEALRVLKPGGHLLAFGGSRTFHRLACAVEDAGFEIRDSILNAGGGGAVESGFLAWIYGSG